MKKYKFMSVLCAVSLGAAMLPNSYVSAETDIMHGDVNGDGSITAVDASLILTEYAVTSAGKNGTLTDTQKKIADVNMDGKADAVDASAMLSYYAYCSVNDAVISVEVFTAEDRPVVPKIPSYIFPQAVDISTIPSFTDKPYCILNNNIPAFDPDDFNGTPFESYEEPDEFGRCGVCVAAVGTELMPTEKRGEIGMIKPTGWHLDKYDFVDGKYLYNRCHLLGYQLTGENANPNNLVTGTRYLNTKGMLPFEDEIASYVKKTDNHVLYRVTPLFADDELVCRGVAMEGWSVEDSGASVCFNVFCYNVQPGVVIDYATGENHADESYIATTTVTETTVRTTVTTTVTQPPVEYDFVANKNSKVFHRPDCTSVDKMSEKNRWYFQGSREELIADGYKPCSNCQP